MANRLLQYVLRTLKANSSHKKSIVLLSLNLLARISHKVPAAVSQRVMSDCGAFGRAPCIHSPLHCLAAN